jgi:hypothetical protein
MYILYNHYGINEDSEMLWLIFTNETRAKAVNERTLVVNQKKIVR